MSNVLGKPISRVDGPEKVTGKAKYAAEFNVPDLTYGFVLSSGIARGRITRIHADDALQLPGVLNVYTHENRPKVAWFDINYKDQDAPAGSPFRPFEDDRVKYSGQPIAMVVAETFELARYAASLVHIEYEEDAHETDLVGNLAKARKPTPYLTNLVKPLPPDNRGNFDEAYAAAAVRVEERYVHGIEHHNPMEMYATTVVYEKGRNGADPKLTIYDKTQGVTNSHLYVAQVFGMSFSDVRVISPYVGGGFGSGLRPQYQLFLAVLAARDLGRSVRVSLTRQQMFTFGHRPATVQTIYLGATTDGLITALRHKAIAETSQFEDYTEMIVNWAGTMYPVANAQFDYKLVALDLYTPLDMRAPGGVTAMAAVEIAVDELAYKLGMDPVELRLKNYAERDLNLDKPFSSKELRECFRQGAERFGWAGRNPEPRSMKQGHNLMGWGMATGIWDASQMPARAEAVLTVNGKLRVSSATADIGTGTYTVMTQIAADTLGMPVADVIFRLGDTEMPLAPIQGGSWTVSTVGSAVKAACENLGKTLFKMARKMPNSPFANLKQTDVEFADGHLRLRRDPSVAVSLLAIVGENGGRAVSETGTSIPDVIEHKKFTRVSHSAVFVEVMVDEELGTVKVTRAVSAIAGGRVLNPKMARSQILGGMVWGLSKALEEESSLDHIVGRFMNHNLSEYHVPVCADIHDMDVIFVEETDDIVNPLGAKGLGEIGIVGMPAAIANAIFHATGKRVRDMPITLDKLL